MKVKMKVSIAGIGFALGPGAETDRFSDSEVERMLAVGMCELIEEPPPALPAIEYAVKSKRKERRA
jgi:hypothetical protein